MNILVTGATGFLGGKLAERLVGMGFKVTGVGRNKQKGAELTALGVHFVPISLQEREDVLTVCKNFDYVFHCAALSSPWGKYQDFYEANVVSTQNIIEACKQSNVKRLIYVSTPSLCFYYDERKDVKESDTAPKEFVNDYAKTKYLAEQEIKKAAEEGLATITIRPRAIFGPGDQAILPRLIKVCEKGKFPQIGSGYVEVDITYVENVVDALLLCMTSGEETLGEIYHITNGVRINLYDVIEDVMRLLGKSFSYKKISFAKAMFLANMMEKFHTYILKNKEPLLTKYTVSVLSQSQTLNIDKARVELGYEPRVSIEEGIKTFADWWKNNK